MSFLPFFLLRNFVVKEHWRLKLIWLRSLQSMEFLWQESSKLYKFLHVYFEGHGQEESFRVHKEVLSCRSDVFEAMMSHGMQEARCLFREFISKTTVP